MNGKQQYYGNIKKRSAKKHDDTLAQLYNSSEVSEGNKDVEEFIDNSADIDEEELKETKASKKKKKKAAEAAKAKKVIKRIILIILILGLLGGGVWLFLQFGNSQNIIGDVNGTETKADEIYYSRLTGREINNAETVTAAATCIMIENSTEARPQSGLNEAGVIYEAVAEGGITRFMAIYQEAKPNYIGPVRSVRLTFAELAKPYQCSIAHVGGSDNALQLIRNNSAYRDIDQFFNGNSYWRIRGRVSPHNVYTRFSMLDELNFNKGYRNSDFKGFARVKADTVPEAPETKANNITIEMSSALFNPVYTYDANSNTYLRSYMKGGDHFSQNEDGTKIRNAPDVVIAMKVTGIARSGTSYEDFTTTGTGDAHIFQNGGVISGRWARDSVDSELKFTDASGNEIQLNRGQTWISLYPSSGKVTWE